jgi:hypothetical protein
MDPRPGAFAEILKDLDSNRLLSRIGQRICQLLGVGSASLLLVDGDELVLGAAYGFNGAMPPTSRGKIADSRTGRVVTTRRPQTSTDMRVDPHWRDAPIVRLHGYRAVL